VDESSIEKIAHASANIGMTYAGMGPDFRVLTMKGRKEVQSYWLQYKDQMPVSQFVKSVASVAQEYTQSGGVRPFGVSLLVAGYDDQGPQLYQVDPSGSYWTWKAAAIGAKAKNARSFLEKRYDAEMEIEDAIHTALLTLKEDFEGAITPDNVEIGVIRSDRQFKILTPTETGYYTTALQ
jgi:20S proteasome subunit alpha 2